jgi:hypothetical protein
LKPYRHSTSVLEPESQIKIRKKFGTTECPNYSGISLSSTANKVFFILINILSNYIEILLVSTKRGVRREKSNMEQIFSLRNIIGKSKEFGNAICSQIIELYIVA